MRGTTGELADDEVVRLADPTTPVKSPLVYRRTGIDLNLEGNELDHISFDGRVVYRNPFPGARFSEDDLGVARCWSDRRLGARRARALPARRRAAGPPARVAIQESRRAAAT